MPLHTQSPLDSKHWKALETLSGKDYDLKLLFALNSHRFKDFSIHSDDFSSGLFQKLTRYRSFRSLNTLSKRGWFG